MKLIGDKFGVFVSREGTRRKKTLRMIFIRAVLKTQTSYTGQFPTLIQLSNLFS